jgi:hypothetical protein
MVTEVDSLVRGCGALAAGGAGEGSGERTRDEGKENGVCDHGGRKVAKTGCYVGRFPTRMPPYVSDVWGCGMRYA